MEGEPPHSPHPQGTEHPGIPDGACRQGCQPGGIAGACLGNLSKLLFEYRPGAYPFVAKEIGG